MIALDTNVLVRLLTRDDPSQAALAVQLFDANEGTDGALFISDVVLVEMSWVLRTRYDVDATALAGALRALLSNATLAWQSRDAAVTAVGWYEARLAGDFADCLIASLAQRHGCDGVATFDQGMRGLPGVRPMA